MRLHLTLAATVVMAFLALPASADLLAYDGLDYTDGVAIRGLSGGFGWDTAWTGSSDTAANTIIGESLGFKNLLTSGGKAHWSTAHSAGRRATDTFGAAGTTRWFSMLWRPQNLTADQFSGMLVGKPLFNNGVGNVVVGHVGQGSTIAMNNDGGSGVVLSNTTWQNDQIYFLVLKVDFASGPDTISLFVDPTPGGPDPLTPNAVKTDLDLTGADLLGNIGFGGFGGEFDEVRYGTTFLDVAPIASAASPEPAVLPLLLLGLPCLRRAIKARMR